MTTPDLVAASWTTAGDAAPLRHDEISPHGFLNRVKAASDAGFRGFGLAHADLVVYRDRHGFSDMRTMFQDHGLVHVELEFLADWWASGDLRAASDAKRRDFLEAAEQLGARQIKIGPAIGDEPLNLDQWAAEFATLARDAENAGTRIALEFSPMANVKNLAEALTLIETAGHRAGGLLIDIWHVMRAGTALRDVAAVPSEVIVGIELDDALAEPVESLWEDTIDHRCLPGEGSFDVPGFIDAVRATGWTGPWGVEILSAAYRERPVDAAVADAYVATMSQFQLAEATTTPRVNRRQSSGA